MKFLITPDKFKGSLSGIEFCEAVNTGIKKIIPDAVVRNLPLADGGDGTIEVANFYLQGEVINVQVKNPFFQPIQASYLFSQSTRTAYIEMAEASGMKLLKATELDCMNATTFGTGEMILDAINNGASIIILGIGGSATNDCGIGMAQALGYQFLDSNNNPVSPVGKFLSSITSINDAHIDVRLKNVDFYIACDVTNPLFGKSGAAYTYAKQKGASDLDVILLDEGLQSFSALIDARYLIDSQGYSGAGAGGGMGIASKVFLNGKLHSGVSLIKKLANFDNEIRDTDWIITGEGKLDSQTLSGKTLQGVLSAATKLGINVAALCGQTNLEKNEIQTIGISYMDTVKRRAKNEIDAMTNSKSYVMAMAEDFAKTLVQGS